MSRARRLAEIAKSNQPAFNGTYWWLADPSGAHLPQPEPHEELVPAAAGHAAASAIANPSESACADAHAAPVPPVSAAATVAAPPRSQDNPSASGLPSKLSNLKEKFQWLGRRSRSAGPE